MHPRNTNNSSDPPNPNPLPFVKPTIAAAPSSPPGNEPPHIQSLITRLHLQPHAEGGYFAEARTSLPPPSKPTLLSYQNHTYICTHTRIYKPTQESAHNRLTRTTITVTTPSADRDPKLVPSPYPSYPASPSQWAAATTSQQDKKGGESGGFNPAVRNASTTMFYLLTPGSPVGFLHRNRGPTVHTLLRGRGRYVVIHASAPSSFPAAGKKGCPGSGSGSRSGSDSDVSCGGEEERVRIESFVAGLDRARGEKQRWIVEGGKYKATFLLPDLDESGEEGPTSKEGMLVAETVVPGFEFFDHEFLERSGVEDLVGKDWAEKLGWLVKRQE
ncbi:hypothetical protein VTI28DRAFT_4025 [Corynascus sepedonium]